jgi:hypothetical protein
LSVTESLEEEKYILNRCAKLHFLSSCNLIKKALRKLVGEALRNEMMLLMLDYVLLPVSPRKARACSPVVTISF